MSASDGSATKNWRGRFFEDLSVGDVFRSRFGRTITDTDNVWFTCITMNTNQTHFNDVFAARTRFERPLVNSCLTLSLVTGLSVPDTSENAAANLTWTDIKLPRPVFVGDTLWAESEVLALRESSSKPGVGIVSIRTRGVNQSGEVVVEFLRTFMLYKSTAPEASPTFPAVSVDWTVGG
jgi:itaconyl-CoA hydratase